MSKIKKIKENAVSKAKAQYEQTKSIRRGYIYSLWVMSLLTLFAVYVVTDAVLSHQADSRLINEAGRQRMRVQQITKNVFLLSEAGQALPFKDSLLIINELKNVTYDFIKTHQRLQARNDEELKGTNTKEITGLFMEIKPQFDSISTISNQIIKTSILSPLNQIGKRRGYTLNAYCLDFLPLMEKIVAQYVADSEKKQMLAIYKTFGLGALFLGCFLFISLYVFKPAVAKIESSIKQIQESKEEIATAEEELRQQNDALLETQRELEHRRDELRAALSYQKSIFDNAGMMIIGVNVEGVISAFNHAAENTLGYAASEIVGEKRMEIFFSVEELKKQAAQIGQSKGKMVKTSFELFANDVTDAGRLEREWAFKTKAGKEIPVLVSITTVRDSEQQVVGYLGIGRDISERKKIEAQLENTFKELQDLYNNAPCGYHSIDSEGYFLHINQTELNWLGYAREEIIGKVRFPDILAEVDSNFREEFAKFKAEGKVSNLRFDIKNKKGEKIPVMLNATAFYDEQGKFVMTRSVMFDDTERKRNEAIIQEQTQALQRYVDSLGILNEQLITEKEKYNHLYSELKSSINYAKRIQTASLPEPSVISWFLADHFIFFKPRDVVSGDFYWFSQKREKIVIIAADCTGHGVPGAFMSLIGTNVLNKIVNTFGVTSPELILYELHKEVRHTLRQAHTDNRDGMDIAITVVDTKEQILEFAGANNPLYYIQNGELQVVKGDKKSIGGMQLEEERIFTKTTIDISIPTTFYLSSDGYLDQFGGAENRKFMSKQFKELLLTIHHLPMGKQKEIINHTFDAWKNDNTQIDDVLVIGARV